MTGLLFLCIPLLYTAQEEQRGGHSARDKAHRLQGCGIRRRNQ